MKSLHRRKDSQPARKTADIADGAGMLPLGYLWLIEHFELPALPLATKSYLLTGGMRRTFEIDGNRIEHYPPQYKPGARSVDQIAFALKHEDINLTVLYDVFVKMDTAEIISYIHEKPNGIYARRIWFFYEWLTGTTLSCPDLKKTARYIPALDSLRYFTVLGVPSVRHRILNNMPGTRAFCPLVRKTKVLEQWVMADLEQNSREVLKQYDPALIARAVNFLYNKETKSTFTIEKESVGKTRAERFTALLRHAHLQLLNTKESLIDLQGKIVDPRFAATDYRRTQSYVGESSWNGELIHYVCPKPSDVPELMDGLLQTWRILDTSHVHPVIIAATVAFGFVFIHPFEDGNGRLHRFLIHNILAQSGFAPQEVIFPVSAAMLRRPTDYDRILEQVARPINGVIEYKLDSIGKMSISGNTISHYRFIDMTDIATQLFVFINDTIETDLAEELNVLTRMDLAKRQIQDIVDMPDSMIYLFIKLVYQNAGHLSCGKRKIHFEMVSREDISDMENAVCEAFAIAR